MKTLTGRINYLYVIEVHPPSDRKRIGGDRGMLGTIETIRGRRMVGKVASTV